MPRIEPNKETAMAVREYNDLLERVTRLPQQEKVDLLAELANLVRDDSRKGKKHSIMELEGLGKEIWAGIDAQEYVNRERDSWNG
jgi:hypothetical protein